MVKLWTVFLRRLNKTFFIASKSWFHCLKSWHELIKVKLSGEIVSTKKDAAVKLMPRFLGSLASLCTVLVSMAIFTDSHYGEK